MPWVAFIDRGAARGMAIRVLCPPDCALRSALRSALRRRGARDGLVRSTVIRPAARRGNVGIGAVRRGGTPGSGASAEDIGVCRRRGSSHGGQ